jgi:aromatic-L-amino-acid decarboxylase
MGKRPPLPLELSGEELKESLALVGQRLSVFLDTIGTLPASQTDGAARLARSLAEPLPERGSSLRNLLRILFEQVMPTALHTSGPGYLGYIPGGGLPMSAVADLIAGITNRYVGLWMAAPGLVALETNVIRWFCAMAGLPESAGGVLTSGGSIANLIAVVTARRERLPVNFLSGTLYTSAHAHHSVRKAAMLAGFPAENVREIPLDAQFRMRTDLLLERIAADRAAGLTPFCVVASAGTTAMGAVDPLPAIATICEQQSLWMHVDAAYGGFFLLTHRGSKALAGIERADSITLDPHKGLFLPYGTGCILVRDRERLQRAHSVSADYLPAPQTEEDRWDFAEMSPELSRDARGLRVWLPLKLAGAGAFRTQLDEKLDLARDAVEVVRSHACLEVVAEPTLSLFAFRVRGDEAATRALISAINQRQRVFLTGVPLEGGWVIRVCVLSFRTHAAHMKHFAEDLEAALYR